MNYQRPTDLNEAIALRASGQFHILAGGTDFYPARVARPITEPVLDLTALGVLRGVAPIAGAGGWRIGALTTWTDLIRLAQAPELAALVGAAREVGGIQIQNQGTVGGNLCNASPAADGVPALAAVNAQVELRSARGIRSLAVTEFVQGNRRTALASDEILTAVLIPAFSANARSAFFKVGHRKYLVISIASVAVCVDFDANEQLSFCAIAVGSCAPAVRRLDRLENTLRGLPRAQVLPRLDAVLASVATQSFFGGLSPIDDVRGSASYRIDAVREIVRRLLSETVSG